MAPWWTWPTAFRKCSLARVWKSTRNTCFRAVARWPGVRDHPAARRIDRDGLGQVNVFARVHRVGGMLGVEVGRSFDGHGVELALEQPFIARQTGVPAGGIDLELLSDRIRFVLEIIGAGDPPVFAGVGEERRNPTAPSPAADEADFESGIGLRAEDKRRLEHGNGGGRPGAGQEGAARHQVGAAHVLKG